MEITTIYLIPYNFRATGTNRKRLICVFWKKLVSFKNVTHDHYSFSYNKVFSGWWCLYFVHCLVFSINISNEHNWHMSFVLIFSILMTSRHETFAHININISKISTRTTFWWNENKKTCHVLILVLFIYTHLYIYYYICFRFIFRLRVSHKMKLVQVSF